MTLSDKEFLTKIHDRLIELGEPHLTASAWKLRCIIRKMPDTNTSWDKMVESKSLDSYRESRT